MRRLVLGISGSSCPIYGIRLLEVLQGRAEVHLVVSEAARRTIALETDWSPEEVRALAHRAYDNRDLAAAIASGSFPTSGMVIAPCSMKTLAAVAHSYTDNLLTRAADVTLKERRPLILVPRETPLHLGHLRNMVAVTEMGAVVAPATVATYHRPRSVEEVIDHTVGRVLDLLGVEHDLARRWTGA